MHPIIIMNTSPQMKLLFVQSFILILHLCHSRNITVITPTDVLSDGDVLISEDENFALGFFSPGNSTNRFIGIWYNKVSEQTVFWVANRDRPINDTSGILSFNFNGDLVLYCCGNPGSVLWSTNLSTRVSGNATIARLNSTGNFILVHQPTDDILWESFDHPTDSMIPFMKLGLDRKTGRERVLTSWKSKDDPSTGNLILRINETGYPQQVLYQNGAPLWRTGPWTGLRWSGLPLMTGTFIFETIFVNNQDEVAVFYSISNTSIFTRFVVEPSGVIRRLTWLPRDGRWNEVWKVPVEECDYYNKTCGPNTNCNPYDPSQFRCTCLPGFEPKSPADWFLRDGSGGCIRSLGVSVCKSGEGFIKVPQVKVPDTSRVFVDMNMSLRECEQMCLNNCSCTAYMNADERDGGFGCLAWHGDLTDTRTFPNNGQDLYIRVDAATLDRLTDKNGSPRKWLIGVGVSAALMVLLIISLIVKKRAQREKAHSGPVAARLGDDTSQNIEDDKYDGETKDLPFLYLSTIATATNNFAFINKLGKGGFGSVYKGILENGKEIAVKRLSESSGQGMEEFRNEVTLIAKLQHRNLVKILGYCIQEDEKMLVYEYMPNKSLDSFLFDDAKRSILDWRTRFEITCGIARGILYLHQDSRLRIIHRDLKTSNVLLDASMNPKISDFGLARICGGDKIEGNTKRVVGTYGYMSPEYAMEGLFSVKSDVYSFGVILLEIISGKKNSSFHQENSSVNLVGHVWKLWREGLVLDIVDPSLDNIYPETKVLRCIQIGLLCVQEFAMDRPAMDTVVVMLGNDVSLPSPKQPAFASQRMPRKEEASSSNERTYSANDMSFTAVEAR